MIRVAHYYVLGQVEIFKAPGVSGDVFLIQAIDLINFVEVFVFSASRGLTSIKEFIQIIIPLVLLHVFKPLVQPCHFLRHHGNSLLEVGNLQILILYYVFSLLLLLMKLRL